MYLNLLEALDIFTETKRYIINAEMVVDDEGSYTICYDEVVRALSRGRRIKLKARRG